MERFAASENGDLKGFLGDHQLKGTLREYRELHLSGDCLLVYLLENGHVKLDGLYTHKELKKKQGALSLFSFLKLC